MPAKCFDPVGNCEPEETAKCAKKIAARAVDNRRGAEKIFRVQSSQVG